MVQLSLLRDLREVVSNPLGTLINKSSAEGIVPVPFKVARIIPIYKAKDKQNFQN